MRPNILSPVSSQSLHPARQYPDLPSSMRSVRRDRDLPAALPRNTLTRVGLDKCLTPLRGRMLDFRSRGPGFESLGHRSVGVSRVTLALALEVGNPTHLRSLYISRNSITPGQFNQI